MTVAAQHHAAVEQWPARLPFPAGDGGSIPTSRLHIETATVEEVAPLLVGHHYLGPTAGGKYAFAGWVDNELVACQVYRQPTARMLPADGSWLELSRWCLTSKAGRNAGSRMMRIVASLLRDLAPGVTTLVSYSDPAHGHTGALYRASGWVNRPTHIEARWHANGVGYPSGNGSWDGLNRCSTKQRWIYRLRETA